PQESSPRSSAPTPRGRLLPWRESWPYRRPDRQFVPRVGPCRLRLANKEADGAKDREDCVPRRRSRDPAASHSTNLPAELHKERPPRETRAKAPGPANNSGRTPALHPLLQHRTAAPSFVRG